MNASLSQSLLQWYRNSHRDLPFRQTRDPYAVWISETMLQQTLVATVIPYWIRWMERFPTITALASADIADVLKMWQGLGYYARARNLHRAAQTIVERHNGIFPTHYGDVLALPGVGRYTAGAVLSIALGQDVPIVDANIVRVLCRLFAISGDPKSQVVQAKLWETAENLIPRGNARDFNQSMMELGALICLPNPKCGTCPVSAHCTAFQQGNPTAFPQHAPRPSFTTQTDVSALITYPDTADVYLLVRRPMEGLWGGLWEFPRVTSQKDESVVQTAERAAREIVALSVTAGEILAHVKHGVTTRKITLFAAECCLTNVEIPKALGCTEWHWVTLADTASYALSSPQVRLVEKLRLRETQPALF